MCCCYILQVVQKRIPNRIFLVVGTVVFFTWFIYFFLDFKVTFGGSIIVQIEVNILKCGIFRLLEMLLWLIFLVWEPVLGLMCSCRKHNTISV